MDTKSLKKQLGAAIAMVLVAAVALGSATYAWFVTNDTVKATTTTTISAQSNAAFMTIAAGNNSATTADATSVTTKQISKALYPATYGEQDSSKKGTWYTGYSGLLTDATLIGDLHQCEDPKGANEAGTTAAAVAGDFLLDQDYNISAKAGQTLSALRVTGVDAGKVAGEDPTLLTALRILVTNSSGTIWEVYGLDDDGTACELKLSSDINNSAVTLADEISSTTDTAVHVYLYYEGSDSNVTTKNLVDNKLTATNAVTVTFTATPNNK